MTHVYSDQFFDYIDAGVKSSANAIVNLLQAELGAASVVDFGCGRGLWLAQWQKSGASEIVGVDGDYVNRTRLSIPEASFRALDLTKKIDLERKFDLSMSLEVAEHLSPEASSTFVKTLVRHSDCVLFSAAVTGQGGEFHINEHPLEYWRELFMEHGYRPYDFVRPVLKDNVAIEPWYRYNTILYADAAGAKRLSQPILDSLIDDAEPIADLSSVSWKLRKLVVRNLPTRLVTKIAQLRAANIARKAQHGVK